MPPQRQHRIRTPPIPGRRAAVWQPKPGFLARDSPLALKGDLLGAGHGTGKGGDAGGRRRSPRERRSGRLAAMAGAAARIFSNAEIESVAPSGLTPIGANLKAKSCRGVPVWAPCPPGRPHRAAPTKWHFWTKVSAFGADPSLPNPSLPPHSPQPGESGFQTYLLTSPSSPGRGECGGRRAGVMRASASAKGI
jgi:hypothetical protein